MGNRIQREAGLVGPIVHVVIPTYESGVRGEGAIVTFDDEVNVVHLEVAIWFEELEALAHILWPVLERANHHL